MPSKCKCGKSQPNYNFLGVKPAIYCASCKEENMVNVKARRCKCGKNRPHFNFAGNLAEFCKDCRLKGMVDVKSVRCVCGKSQPTFGVEGQTARHCKACKTDGMTQLRSKKCFCGKVTPTVAVPGASKPTHCATCKTDGMVYVFASRCVCGKVVVPVYGFPGDQKATCCSVCRRPGMKNITARLCRCGLAQPSYGYLSEGKAICCSSCKQEDMENIYARRCSEEGCDIILMNGQQYCANHDTEKKRVTKRKEFILGHHLKDVISMLFTAWNKMPKNARECGGAYRPDFVYVLDHYIIIVECDEFQHNNYDISCDRKRMVDLFNAYGGMPILFIRWNPDPFKVDGRTRVTRMQTRLDVCAQTLERELKRTVEEVASMPMFCIIKLFFDNNDLNSSTPFKQESHLTTQALETGCWIEEN